jgi:hypothetical protein
MVMEVVLRMNDGTVVKLPNITEIHYKYPRVEGEERVAFESDIDQMGQTHKVADIAEFEALSTRKQYVDNMLDMNILILEKMGVDLAQYIKYAMKVIDDVQRITPKGSSMDSNRPEA